MKPIFRAVCINFFLLMHTGISGQVTPEDIRQIIRDKKAHNEIHAFYAATGNDIVWIKNKDSVNVDVLTCMEKFAWGRNKSIPHIDNASEIRNTII